jgi:4-amino-4-deoxy-L-arabinose transferase-like glycosyltransferase
MKPVLLFAIVLLAAFFRLHRIDSLPPGDGYDPAYYGVDALQLLRGERLPPMLPSNREPLFSTIVAAVFLVVGPSTLGIHLASALVGLATVPAVYFVAEALFPGTDPAGEERSIRRWGALVAALVIAVSYWHLNWSRYGVRAILVPLFAALTFTFLWRGLRDGDRGDFVLCGISLGLSLYTYEAARLLPVLVIFGCAAAVWQRRSITRRDWTNVLVLGVMALMVFAPMGIHFVRHPGTLTHRMEDVIVTQEAQGVAGKLQAVLDRTAKALRSFTMEGDRTPYSTIPGRPSLNPFFSALFLLGIALSVARVSEPPYLFLLAWLVVMTIPATLAGSGPSAKRAIGALPAVALLISVGALSPLRLLQRWTARRSAEWLAAVWTLVVASGFVYSGVLTYRDYFVRWASNPGLFTHFELGISAIGEYACGLPRDERIYISPELPVHPSIRFHSGLREDIRGYNGRQCLVLPEQTRVDTTYIIVPGKDGKSLPLLERYLPQGRVVDRGGYHRGDPYFLAYRIPAGNEAQGAPTHTVEATWKDSIGLLGYDLDRDVGPAGDSVQVTLYYRDLKRLEQRYTVFVHLLSSQDPDTGSLAWAQDDSEPCRGFYPTSSWHEGEIVIDRLELTIPLDAPPGQYDLAMGFYDVWTGERLSVTEAEGPAEHDVVSLGKLQVVAAQ